MATTILKNLKEAKNRKPSQHLQNAISYIMNPEKTENGLWVGSNCGITAQEIYSSMMTTKNEFHKTWGRQGYHFVISFRPGEADERTCYNVGKEFCEKYLGEGYEYVYAVHNDTMVLNTGMSMAIGRKIYSRLQMKLLKSMDCHGWNMIRVISVSAVPTQNILQ